MSKSRRRSKSRRQGRPKCPSCGSKSVHILNKTKDQFILECKRPSCETKWHIPIDMPSMKMRLKAGDIKYEEVKKELPKEDKELIKEVTAMPAVELVGGSYRLKQN